MSEGLNRVILIGNLGQDPELKRTQSDQAVLNMRIATAERYKDRSGEWKDATEWHNVDIWGKRAEALSKMLRKGSRVGIEGKIKTRTWDGNDGKKQYRTGIVASNVLLLDGKRQGSEPDDDFANGWG